MIFNLFKTSTSKALCSLGTLFLFALLTVSPLHSQTVNPIIGDESFLETFGRMPDSKTDNQLRVKTHLKYVEEMLRSKDVSHLSAEMQARRLQLLDLLRDYYQRGKFPQNHHSSGDRKPCFIDDSGTICAVGYLVEQTAGRETAEMLNNEFQYEEIMNMNNPILENWIAESGFTKEEIATIQPTYENWFPEPKRHRIGIRSGIMASNVSGTGFFENTESRLGFSGGLTIDRFINNRFYWSIDALYSKMGFNAPVIFTDETGLPIASSELTYTFSYFSFPVRFNWQGKWRLRPIASVGLAPNILSKALVSEPVFDDQGNLTSRLEDKELTNSPTFDLSGHVQLGASYGWNKFVFQSFLEVQQGLLNQTDTDFFEQNKFHHRAVSLNVAIKYNI